MFKIQCTASVKIILMYGIFTHFLWWNWLNPPATAALLCSNTITTADKKPVLFSPCRKGVRMTDLLSRVSRSAFGYLGGDGGGGGGENEFVGSIVDVDGMQIQVGVIHSCWRSLLPTYSYRAFCINTEHISCVFYPWLYSMERNRNDIIKVDPWPSDAQMASIFEKWWYFFLWMSISFGGSEIVLIFAS